MKSLRTFISILFVSITISGLSQVNTNEASFSEAIADSLKRAGIIFNEQKRAPEIILSTDQAVKFLQGRIQPQFWKNSRDPLRRALGQLVFEASHPPYDTADYFMRRYPFDSLYVPWDKFYIWEPLKLKIPVIKHPELPLKADSLAAVAGLKDTTILVVVDTLHEVTSDWPQFPFTFYNYPFQADSIRAAVGSLLDYVQTRDSSVINITGLGDALIPVWLNSKSGLMQRYWLKNELNDSVTMWIGSTSRNTLSLFLEKGITFRRPALQGNYTEARINVKEVDKSKLLDVKQITVKPQYWKYRSEASFALNQASLTNWVKGGESSISTSMDITGYADYNNKLRKVTSSNFARLKYGLIWTGENGVRKNLDLLETNSKLNHKAFGKFDFSGILLFKTQIAKGYNYPNDSIAVSKFMNPAILTIGFGLDYKPNKSTSINFSPFSYKGTFVPDTAIVDKTKGIDQTKYGIPKDRRSLNEPGASFMITNEFKPVKTVTITNRLQLFTNYINHPQNVDIDWELIGTASLNWFTDVRINTHLIFDNDTKTPVLGDDKKPLTNPDGSIRKTARVQFKELLGFSFIFRF